jgi:hypothetical protein
MSEKDVKQSEPIQDYIKMLDSGTLMDKSVLEAYQKGVITKEKVMNLYNSFIASTSSGGEPTNDAKVRAARKVHYTLFTELFSKSASKQATAFFIAGSGAKIMNSQQKIDAIINEYKSDPQATVEKYKGRYEFDENGYPMRYSNLNKTLQRIAPYETATGLFIGSDRKFFLADSKSDAHIFEKMEPFKAYNIKISINPKTKDQDFEVYSIFDASPSSEEVSVENSWNLIKGSCPSSLFVKVADFPSAIERSRSVKSRLSSVIMSDITIQNINKNRTGSYSADVGDADGTLGQAISQAIFKEGTKLELYDDGTELLAVGTVFEKKVDMPDGTKKAIPLFNAWAVLPSYNAERVFLRDKQKEENIKNSINSEDSEGRFVNANNQIIDIQEDNEGDESSSAFG